MGLVVLLIVLALLVILLGFVVKWLFIIGAVLLLVALARYAFGRSRGRTVA